MAFYGAEVIYNGVSSALYDLQILEFNETMDAPAGSDSAVFEKWVYRKTKSYYFGRSQNTALEFDITLGSGLPIDGSKRSAIEKLFLGKMSYLPFQIVQEDISDVIFDVIFTKGTTKYVGNLNVAIALHAKCNAPWGFTSTKTFSKSYSGSSVVTEDIIINNISDDADYLYPLITFKTGTLSPSFSLINHSDANRNFYFGTSATGVSLQQNETIVVDNNLQSISSDNFSGLLRLPNFIYKKFFRLVPGANLITVSGGITSFSISYKFARKIGG